MLNRRVSVVGKYVEQTASYKYLGHEIRLGRNNQICELPHRIESTWATFGKLNYGFKSDIPTCLERKIFDGCVLSVITYGAETLTLSKNVKNKVRVTQSERMLGVSIGDWIPNDEWSRRTREAVERITTVIIEWRPRQESFQNRGSSPMRWTDDLKRVVQKKGRWKELREIYAQPWTHSGWWWCWYIIKLIFVL